MSFIEKVKTEKTYIPGRKLNHPLIEAGPAEGDIGLELEIEGRNLPQGPGIAATRSPSGTAWGIHPDGSLRGGVEYVLTRPTPVDEIPGLLTHLFGELNRPGVEVRHSNRTSTHVHINVRGMKPSALTSFILLWGLFEPAAVHFAGEQRKSNQFCLSSKDTSGWLAETWLEALRTGRFSFSNDMKYTSLNLGAFSRFGSFEFRTMAGATEPEDVIGWVRFLYGLRELSKELLPDEVLYATSERTPTGILEDIVRRFDVSIGPKLLSLPDFNYECIRNFRDFQELAFFLPWSELRKEIDKKYVANPFARSR